MPRRNKPKHVRKRNEHLMRHRQELQQSNAAGPHEDRRTKRQRTRGAQKRQHIEEDYDA